jgi:uncharacterized C2H2 Zn-finger protein
MRGSGKIRCPRCGAVLENEWPCLTHKDAKDCPTAKDIGVKPKRLKTCR